MLWHSITAQKAAENLQSGFEGLSAQQAAKRLAQYGKNRLDEPLRTSFFMKILNQMCDYMVIILLLAAAVSFFVSYIGGKTDFVDPVMILAIVVLNSVIGVIQENKAEKALEALKKMTTAYSMVRRDGQIQKIPSEDIVPGDVIQIKSGDIVPADARIIRCNGLKTDESALTGESLEITKNADVLLPEDITLGDRKNMLWQSGVVTGGRGEAIVVATGMNTQTGRVAKMISGSDAPQTPLQEKIAKTGKTLALAAIVMCAVIFLLGLLRTSDIMEMFMTSVSLAVAVIPEGLPAIITIILSLGIRRMANYNAVVRKMSAVETLGSATVICSDKTGTLTRGKMTVVDYYGDKKKILEMCLLCSDSSGATELALENAAAEYKNDALYKAYRRVADIPFDSTRKMMTTVHKTADGYRVMSKGAPEVILSKCRISHTDKSEALKQENKMAQNALRVIAVAYADSISYPQNPEQNLTFAGLAGMKDPPRKQVRQAVATCIRAGIKPVMITGDFPKTALAVAEETGICSKNEKAITGAEIDKMTALELAEKAAECSVFARVTPEHKMKIVRAYQSKGHVVAMTGDGVNDAPALKIADIGCAMGKSGTEVAKEAADVVLTDDNFSTIVNAVREGRGIYSNIKKTVHFLLSSNIGELSVMLFAILLGRQTPLAAIQLLWVNLVTDSLPAIALGMEQPEKDIMDKKPISRSKSFFSDGMAFDIVAEGIMIGLLSLIAFLIGANIFGSNVCGSTMAFATVSISQIMHCLNMKSEKSLFSVNIFKNKFMLGSFFICIAMQFFAVQLPQSAAVFKVVALGKNQWFIVFGLSVVPIIVCEFQKLLDKMGKKTKNACNLKTLGV